MKTTLLLIGSICLNLVLGAMLLLKDKPSGPPAQPAAAIASNALPQRPEKVRPAQPAAIATVTNKFDWRSVESEDYRKYIVNLRAIGCPEETIRDIIIADVNKLFESRLKEFGVSTNKFQFWKTGNFFAEMFNEEKMAKHRELAAEKKALLKELLGIDLAEKPGETMAAMNPFESMLDFLPASKQNELIELEQKYAAKLMKSMKDIQRGDMTAMKQIQAEKDAEMLKILTPQEKEEYDLRMSQSAMMMRMQMSAIELTEQEFRDLFKLRKSFDDEYSLFGAVGDKQLRDQRSAAQKELDGKMRTILGEDRFNEYKYDASFNQSSLKQIAQEHNVPKANALKVFEIRNIAQEQAQKVRSDQSLTPEQRQGALDGIRQETEIAVGNLIGQPALKAYLEKGSWLKNLNRDRAPQSTN